MGENLGRGKCVTLSGGDPEHAYHAGKSRQCPDLCRSNAGCYAYSASSYNCLLWLEPIKGGGATWGNAHCMRIRDNPEGGGGKKNKADKKKKNDKKSNKKNKKNKKDKKNKKNKKKKKDKKNNGG